MDFIISLLYKYGLPAILVIILLEYACFPISSEIVLPLSGALAVEFDIPIYILLPLSVLAGLTGTGICFFVARAGGQLLIDRIKNKFPKMKKGIDSSAAKFARYGKYAVFFGRMIPLCRTYIAFVAGAVKQPVHEFFIWSFLGITIWNSLLIGIGYLLCDNWSYASACYIKYKAAIIPCLLIIILFIIYKKLPKKRQNKSA